MKRRTFIGSLAAQLALTTLLKPSELFSENTSRQLSITIDDPVVSPTPHMNPMERNDAILKALKSHGDLKAALFVCGHKVDRIPGRALLKSWDKRGHILGNHSYSHLYYNSNDIDSDKYIADMIRGESIISHLSGFRKLYRFPYLKEGNTVEKRDAVRTFLAQNGYRTGHVTIDTSDWYVDQRLANRLEANPAFDPTPYKSFYIDHMIRQANFYDDLAVKAIGRSVKHTLLIHHNLLNALFLDDLLIAFESEGWELIDAERAFEDEVFLSKPDIIPAGESIIWALAKETGRFDHLLRYPGEDSEYEREAMDKLGL